MEKFDKIRQRFLYSRYVIVPIIILELLSLVLVYFEDTYVSYGLSHIVQLIISTAFIAYIILLSGTLNRFARQLHNQKKVYDNLPYTFFYINSKGKVKMERNSYIIFGHELKNKRLRELAELLPDDLFNTLQKTFAEFNHIDTQKSQHCSKNIEISISPSHFKLYLKPVASFYNNGYGLLACFIDISSEREQINKLNQLMHRYRLIAYEQEMLLESLPLPIWSRPESDSNIGYYNQSYYELTNRAQQEQGGANFDIIYNSSKQLGEIVRPYHSTRSIGNDQHKQELEVHEYDRKDSLGTIGYALPLDKKIHTLKNNSDALKLLLDSQKHISLIFNQNLQLETYSSKFTTLLGVDKKWINRHNDFSSLFDKMRESSLLPETRSYKEFKKDYITMMSQSKSYSHQENFHLLDGRQMTISIQISQDSEFKIMNIEFGE
jgi:hypothetical protein